MPSFVLPWLLLPALCAAEIPLNERLSGYAEMRAETRAMQDDDSANPGMLWVLEGQSLWSAGPGGDAKPCAACHGDAATGMRGVAVRYPAFESAAGRVINLEQRINLCRVQQQRQPAFAPESRELLALSAWVARQSQGLPIEVSGSGRNAAALAAGRAEFQRRRGQLNLSCEQCHDERHGRHLGGSLIPQAHPTGYPIYRLEWQAVGSLQRRLRACMSGVRSEAYDYGAPELVNLELFLMWRARGMPLEAPGVRP
ncbi:MAG: sulfur oxidation c-type cytochrome SoxA [Rhodoferax sp.]|nr:sulfur oxidation c-type cytochrome SoxA [Rhodoferax sp.]